METKFCPKCKRDLPLSMYYKDKSRKDGLSCYCKECKLKQAKEYQQTHKEEKKAYKIAPQDPRLRAGLFPQGGRYS